MKRTRIIALIAILLVGLIGTISVLPAHASITFVGSGSNTASVVVSSIVVTYTSSANHFVVVIVMDDGTVSSVTDNAAGGSSVFTKLASKAVGSLDNLEEWGTTFSGSKAATSFTVTFTGNVDDAVALVGEYAGGTGLGVTTTTSGSSTTQTITATVSASTSWAICGIGPQVNAAQSASTGNMRVTAHTTVISSAALVDNTGGASSDVCATTTTSSSMYAAAAVDLKSQAFDYSLSNNGPISISAGATKTVTITATNIALPQSVTLSCVGGTLPAGFTCNSFTNNPGTPTFSSVLSFTVAISVNPGSYSFNVTGSPLGATTTPTKVSVTVLAFDYSLSNNSPVTITQGSFGIVIITAANISTPRSITLSCTGLTSGITCQNFTPATGTPTFTSNLAIAVTSFVSPGIYKFNVTGTPLGATTTPTLVTVDVIPPVACSGFFPISFAFELAILGMAIFLTRFAIGIFPSRFGVFSLFFAFIIMVMELVFLAAPQYYVTQCAGILTTQTLFLPLLINTWLGTFFVIGAYWVVVNIFHYFGRNPFGRTPKENK